MLEFDKGYDGTFLLRGEGDAAALFCHLVYGELDRSGENLTCLPNESVCRVIVEGEGDEGVFKVVLYDPEYPEEAQFCCRMDNQNLGRERFEEILKALKEKKAPDPIEDRPLSPMIHRPDWCFCRGPEVLLERLCRIGYSLADFINYHPDLEIDDPKLPYFSPEKVAAFIRGINGKLGGEYFSEEWGGLKAREVWAVDDRLLSEVEKRIGDIHAAVEQLEDYRVLWDALSAVPQTPRELQAQQRIAKEKIPFLFGGVKPLRMSDRNVYHGIKFARQEGQVLQDLVDPYIDLALSIQREGLRPSPHGLHNAMDKNIRPVYMVDSPKEIHGILFFELNPGRAGYQLFDNSLLVEFVVYPGEKLDVPLKLYLVSRDMTVKGYAHESYGVDDDELGEFRNLVARRMLERRIEFTTLR